MRCGLTQPVGFDTAVKNYNSPYEYVRKSTGYGEDYGNNYGGGEYYDVVVVEQT
jgi:hypothetical protein